MGKCCYESKIHAYIHMRVYMYLVSVLLLCVQIAISVWQKTLRAKQKGWWCVCERVWWARCIREPKRLTHSVLTQFTSNVVDAVSVAVAIGVHTQEISGAENSTKMKSAKLKILDIYLQNCQYCKILKEINQSAKKLNRKCKYVKIT